MNKKRFLIENEDLFLCVDSVESLLKQNGCPDIDKALSSLGNLGQTSWTRNDGQEILVEVMERETWFENHG